MDQWPPPDPLHPAFVPLDLGIGVAGVTAPPPKIPLISRQPDPRQVRRGARNAEILAFVLNSLTRQRIIKMDGDEWSVDLEAGDIDIPADQIVGAVLPVNGGTGLEEIPIGAIPVALTANPSKLTPLVGVEGQAIQFGATGVPQVVPMPIPKEKFQDETISNDAVLGPDVNLTYSLAANTRYCVQLNVVYSTTTNAGYVWSLTGPGSLTRIEGLVEDWLAGAGTFIETIVNGSYPTGGGAATANQPGYVRIYLIIHTGATAGTLAFEWSQNTAHADNTSTRAGSTMKVTKLN